MCEGRRGLGVGRGRRLGASGPPERRVGCSWGGGVPQRAGGRLRVRQWQPSEEVTKESSFSTLHAKRASNSDSSGPHAGERSRNHASGKQPTARHHATLRPADVRRASHLGPPSRPILAAMCRLRLLIIVLVRRVRITVPPNVLAGAATNVLGVAVALGQRSRRRILPTPVAG